METLGSGDQTEGEMGKNPDPGGRPKKDPGEKRSEFVPMRMCPSREKILDQEKERRGASRSELIQRISFEEIEPHEREIPFPNVIGEISDLGREIEAKAEDAADETLVSEMRGLRSDMMMIGARVADQYELRQELQVRAESETKDALVQVRFKPRQKRWLKAKARQAGTGASPFLRENLLKGVRKRDRLEETDRKIQGWIDRMEKILERGDESSAGEVALVRKQAREIAEDIQDLVQDRLFG